MSTIGQRISELRKNNAFSQDYVAEKLNVSRQAVSKWEQDLSAPDTYNLIAIAELFDVSVEYIATGKLREAAPTSAAQTSAPPQKSGITARQILGLILIPLGILSGILGFLFAELLIIAAIYLTIIGILCVSVKNHFIIYLAWTLLVLTFPIIFMIMPVTPATGTTGSGTGIGGILLILFIGLLVLTAIFTVMKIIKNRRK